MQILNCFTIFFLTDISRKIQKSAKTLVNDPELIYSSIIYTILKQLKIFFQKKT